MIAIVFHARDGSDFSETLRIDCREDKAYCYGLVCAAPPSPLRVVYDISSDDKPCPSNHSVGSDDYFRGEDVIYL